jgi:hypothetical protein
VPAYNSHKISWPFITLLLNAVIVTERKYRPSLVLWSLCCCHMTLRMGGWRESVCLSLGDPDILPEAADKLDAICETEQPTDAGTRRRPRKCRST